MHDGPAFSSATSTAGPGSPSLCHSEDVMITREQAKELDVSMRVVMQLPSNKNLEAFIDGVFLSTGINWSIPLRRGIRGGGSFGTINNKNNHKWSLT